MRIWVNPHTATDRPRGSERYFTCGIQYWGPWGTGYGMGRWLTIMMCWLAWYTAVGVCAPGRMEGLLFGMVALGGCIWGLWKNWGGEKKRFIYLFLQKAVYRFYYHELSPFFPLTKILITWIRNTSDLQSEASANPQDPCPCSPPWVHFLVLIGFHGCLKFLNVLIS